MACCSHPGIRSLHRASLRQRQPRCLRPSWMGPPTTASAGARRRDDSLPRPEADVAATPCSSPTVSCSTSLLVGSQRRQEPAEGIPGPQQPGTLPPSTPGGSCGGTVPEQNCALPWWRLLLVEGPGLGRPQSLLEPLLPRPFPPLPRPAADDTMTMMFGRC